MNSRLALAIVLFCISCQGRAWIAYGFQSGMSRFEVARYLSERELELISEGARQMIAGSRADNTRYQLFYCTTPQKLYLMKYRLDDTPAAFAMTLEKYEKRYGKPEGLNPLVEARESANWQDVVVALIWDVNEFETILLTHDDSGTSAEFQDLSVCD